MVTAELADALDLAFDLVAGDGGGDARRRAGHDDVAGRERDHFRELGDDLRHVPDQLIEVAVLAQFAVDLERDLALGRMADFARRLDRSARRGMVERLADFPRPLQVARGDLQVAAGEIDADGVAVDAVIGLGDRDVAAAALERDHEFDLVVHVLGQRRIGHRSAVRHDRVGGLGEEERRRPLVLPHLADVLDIVAADAPDAANGESLGWCRRPRWSAAGLPE